MKKLTRLFAVLLAVMVMFTAFPIQAEAATVKLNKTKATVYVGKSVTLKMMGTSKKVTWSSSNEKIATVSKMGKVTAKKTGKATITAKVGQQSYKCGITVKKPYISATKKMLYEGKSFTLKLTGTDIKSVKSSDTKVATVTKTGKVVAKKAGNTTITLNGKDGKSYKCKVTVKKPYISKVKRTLIKGESFNLKLVGTEIKSVKSSNTKVATVTKTGKVVAKEIGTATITLKGKNGKSYKCNVTVQKKHSTKSVSWGGGDIPLDNMGISIPTIEEFNRTGLVPGAKNWWTGVEGDKTALSNMNRIYLTCENIGDALIAQGVSAESVNGFTVSQGSIWWSWNGADNHYFELTRDRVNGYYVLTINQSLKDAPYGTWQLADWNKDIVKTLCSFISSEPETLYNYIYDCIYGDSPIYNSKYVTVGDCKLKMDPYFVIKNEDIKHVKFYIKGK